MAFDTLEQRGNAAVMRRLANARALQVGATQDFPVVFDRAFLQGDLGAGGTHPVASALDADVAGFVSNATQVVIRGATYTVRDQQPDGAGFTVLVLEVA